MKFIKEWAAVIAIFVAMVLVSSATVDVVHADMNPDWVVIKVVTGIILALVSFVLMIHKL